MANILWIEDEANKIAGLVRPLKMAGHIIIVAKDKENALKKLALHSDIDLIILDIIIPEGTDAPRDKIELYEGIKLLRELKSRTNVPIIILSVVSDEDALNEIRSLGVSKILRKGAYLPSDLKTEVYNTLGIQEI